MPESFETLTRSAPVRVNSYDPATRTFDAVIATPTPVSGDTTNWPCGDTGNWSPR